MSNSSSVKYLSILYMSYMASPLVILMHMSLKYQKIPRSIWDDFFSMCDDVYSDLKILSHKENISWSIPNVYAVVKKSIHR